MSTAVDTNILAALLRGAPEESRAARASLESASHRGRVVVSAAVYAELCAAPGRDQREVDAYLASRRIQVDWDLGEAVWRSAALAYREYAERRREQRGGEPRRILADFVIGAHALHHAGTLLTADQRLYRAAFPSLMLLGLTDL